MICFFLLSFSGCGCDSVGVDVLFLLGVYCGSIRGSIPFFFLDIFMNSYIQIDFTYIFILFLKSLGIDYS